MLHDFHQLCKPTFNHLYALARLKDDGYKLGVCSNSVKKTVVEMMNMSSLSQYLDIIISSQDVKEPKPSPEIYSLAMNKLGVNPEECLILEDNPNGIQAAIASKGHLLKIGVPSDVTYQSITALSKIWSPICKFLSDF